MSPEGDDPRAVTAIDVAAEDVVAAYEHNLDRDPRAVLRLTPPFHGRMRARLHVEQGGDYDATSEPIHLPPGRLLDAERVPPRPSADDTEDGIRADPAVEYDVVTHRERHAAAMEEWRAAVADAVVDAVTAAAPSGTHEVSVATLGADP